MQCVKYKWWKVPLLLPKFFLFYELTPMWYLAINLNTNVCSRTRYSHNNCLTLPKSFTNGDFRLLLKIQPLPSGAWSSGYLKEGIRQVGWLDRSSGSEIWAVLRSSQSFWLLENTFCLIGQIKTRLSLDCYFNTSMEESLIEILRGCRSML